MAKTESRKSSAASDQSPRPVRRMAPELRRRQIVAEAARLISISGFNAVSLADIARACGVAKSLVVHYFPSMNHLLAAVLDYRDEKSFAEIVDSTLPDPTPTAVRAFTTKAVEYNLGQRELIRLHHVLDAEALSPDHPAHAYFVARAADVRRVHERLLAWKPDPPSAAVQFLAFWDGLERQWLRDPGLDVLSIWSDFCDRFFAR
jgi:AcrR family transcriptional regulator